MSGCNVNRLLCQIGRGNFPGRLWPLTRTGQLLKSISHYQLVHWLSAHGQLLLLLLSVQSVCEMLYLLLRWVDLTCQPLYLIVPRGDGQVTKEGPDTWRSWTGGIIPLSVRSLRNNVWGTSWADGLCPLLHRARSLVIFGAGTANWAGCQSVCRGQSPSIGGGWWIAGRVGAEWKVRPLPMMRSDRGWQDGPRTHSPIAWPSYAPVNRSRTGSEMK